MKKGYYVYIPYTYMVKVYTFAEDAKEAAKNIQNKDYQVISESLIPSNQNLVIINLETNTQEDLE